MIIISHRRNTIAELVNTEKKYGVEVDIRTNNNELIIHHDPFADGENFEEWLNYYNHDTLILNIKEEGLEARLLDLMKSKEINNFFFLDQSFPFIVKWMKQGMTKSALRFSEYESVYTALSLKDQVDWIWVDCFNVFPLSKEDYSRLKEANFKLCLVSPELQGRDSVDEIIEIHKYLEDNLMNIDAVCTKKIHLWEQLGNERHS